MSARMSAADSPVLMKTQEMTESLLSAGNTCVSSDPLEGRQPGLAVARRHYAALPDGATSGAHADRTARGRTSSSHRSTSSAPSM